MHTVPETIPKSDPKTVLMIGFHFPPAFGSSGLQRMLSFVKAVDADPGWRPVILSAAAFAYNQTSDAQLADVPEGAVVHRAIALDSARHLSVRGRYVARTAIPDRWASWYPFAVFAGSRLIRKHRPDVIWSTYPIATAHTIAATLARRSGIPWVCDFRDPMVEYVERSDEWFPTDGEIRAARLRIEARCIETASRLVFCTEGARRICLDRHPGFPADDALVVPNGFDESIFLAVETERRAQREAQRDRVLTLLHSGTLYPGSDRDPAPFLAAIRDLHEAGSFDRQPVRIVLRASGYDEVHRRTVDELGIGRLVEFRPALPYRDAIAEMMDADVLLLFQGHTSNPAIPAKLYEYLRARRPIFALTDAAGETAKLLDSLETGLQAPIDDSSGIAAALRRLLDDLRDGGIRMIDESALQSLSRERRSVEFLRILQAVENDSAAA